MVRQEHHETQRDQRRSHADEHGEHDGCTLLHSCSLIDPVQLGEEKVHGQTYHGHKPRGGQRQRQGCQAREGRGLAHGDGHQGRADHHRRQREDEMEPHLGREHRLGRHRQGLNDPEIFSLQGHRRGGEEGHGHEEAHCQGCGSSGRDGQRGEDGNQVAALEEGEDGEDHQHQNAGAGIHHIRGAGGEPLELSPQQRPACALDADGAQLSLAAGVALGGERQGNKGLGEEQQHQHKGYQAQKGGERQTREIAHGSQTQMVKRQGGVGFSGQRRGVLHQERQKRLHLTVAIEIDAQEGDGEHHGHQRLEPSQPPGEGGDAPGSQRGERQAQAGQQQRQKHLGEIACGGKADLGAVDYGGGQEHGQVHAEVHEPQKDHAASKDGAGRDGHGEKQFIVLGVIELRLGKKYRAYQGENEAEEPGQAEVEPGEPQHGEGLADSREHHIKERADAENQIEIHYGHEDHKARGALLSAGGAEEAQKPQAKEGQEHLKHLPFLPVPGRPPPGWRRPSRPPWSPRPPVCRRG